MAAFFGFFGVAIGLLRIFAAITPLSKQHKDNQTNVKKDLENWPFYTVLVPLYKESNIVPRLMQNLAAIDYPASTSKSIRRELGNIDKLAYLFLYARLEAAALRLPTSQKILLHKILREVQKYGHNLILKCPYFWFYDVLMKWTFIALLQ